MKRLATFLEGFGFILILLGGSAMDSASLALPIGVTLIGVAVLYAGASIEGVLF